jgi:hypothetical protein
MEPVLSISGSPGVVPMSESRHQHSVLEWMLRGRSGRLPTLLVSRYKLSKEIRMHYMLLIYTNEDAAARDSVEEMARIREGHRAVMEEAAGRGILKGADPLQPTSSATTVRAQDGKVLVTDGPFAETKEQLAGYYILDCENLDEAIDWAAKIPTACGGREGCIEIRPLRIMTGYPQ